MSKKYHIYVSTSGDDLKAERREALKTITELGAIPITLEGFDHADADDRCVIKKAVEECDYLIVIAAHKRALSQETEIAWAEKARVPVLAFIIDDKARWKAAKKETQPAEIKALAAFKKRLALHTAAYWTTTADLVAKLYAQLGREMNLNPRAGWVPGDDAATGAEAIELARLLRENAELRRQLGLLGDNAAPRFKEELKKTLKVLAANQISLSFWYADGENWEGTTIFKYLKLFRLLAPELIVWKNTSELTRFLGNILNPDLSRTVRKENPTPTNTIKKIMADFGLLKLVRPVKTGGRNTPQTGDDEGWEVTEFGRELFAMYRLRQMSRALKRNETVIVNLDKDS